jgi:eukaryotic sulfide quinone oxidoreductase
MFTLVGGGMKTLDDSWRPTKDVLSPLVSWVKDKADSIDPKSNKVVTKRGDVIEYE